MNITTEDTLRLVNHLSGDETEDEKRAIEEEMAIRPELQIEYEKLKKLSVAFKVHALTKTIQDVHNSNIKPKRSLKYNPYLLLVACTTLVVGATGLFRYRQNARNEELFTRYYAESSVQINSVTFTESDTKFLKDGLASLNKQEFTEAIANFSQSKHPMASWYLALSYLRDNDKKNAKKVLQKITKDKHNLFSEKAAMLLDEFEH
jgi:hypothetical protein